MKAAAASISVSVVCKRFAMGEGSASASGNRAPETGEQKGETKKRAKGNLQKRKGRRRIELGPMGEK